jgi:hypothetical protein
VIDRAGLRPAEPEQRALRPRNGFCPKWIVFIAIRQRYIQNGGIMSARLPRLLHLAKIEFTVQPVGEQPICESLKFFFEGGTNILANIAANNRALISGNEIWKCDTYMKIYGTVQKLMERLHFSEKATLA